MVDQVVHSTEGLVDNIENQVSTLIEKYHASKNKRVSKADQLKLSQDPLVQGCFLLSEGKVDALVAGAIYPTSDVIRTGLMVLPKAGSYISSSFLLEKKQARSFLFADAGVIAQPTLEQLVDIAGASLQTWQTLQKGRRPVVAFLSYATGSSASGPLVDLVAGATKGFEEQYPSVDSVGPVQFDAAWDANVGLRKGISDKIAGRANIFIFPDLSSANIAYKVAQRLGNFQAYGPILQGFNLPYSDLSRGCSKDEIKVSCLIQVAKVLAQRKAAVG